MTSNDFETNTTETLTAPMPGLRTGRNPGPVPVPIAASNLGQMPIIKNICYTDLNNLITDFE